MTADLIYGQSILPKKFREGLKYWRSSLLNVSAQHIDRQSNYQLVETIGDDYGCLKFKKNESTQQLVYDNKIPIKIGQYLEIKATLKLKSGSAPDVRVVATPMSGSSTIITGMPTQGPKVTVPNAGSCEVSAIVGSGNRDGVDMAWGLDFESMFFGLEFSGPNGGEIYIQDIEIIDATGHFLSTNSDWVDIRDFGAIGNGKHDCHEAFVRADAEADGRAIFIPKGSYFVGSTLTLKSPIRAYGRMTCDEDTPIMLSDCYNLETYMNVFKELGFSFRKALQALYRFKEHFALDLCGRTIPLHEPVDVGAIAGIPKYTKTHTIHNGQFSVRGTDAWKTKIVKASASYSSSKRRELSNVDKIEQIEVGSLIQGAGIGREVYVVSVDVAGKKITTSSDLRQPASRQSYQFSRFRFMLDFSGLNKVWRMELRDLDFDCHALASSIMLPHIGISNRIIGCWFRQPKDRAICSHHEGCFCVTIRGCYFNSCEEGLSAKDRQSIAISLRRNDGKIIDCLASFFLHFCFLDQSGYIITGNHFYQGNFTKTPDRTAGIVICYKNGNSCIVGNYVDNAHIEISNEQEYYYKNWNKSLFGGVTITGNYFCALNVDKNYHWIVLRPYGNGHHIDGLEVCDNTFYTDVDQSIDRVEAVYNSNGSFNFDKTRNLRFDNNGYNGIVNETHSPVLREVKKGSATSTWTQSFSDVLPFGAKVLRVESVVPMSDLSRREVPLAAVKKGSRDQGIELSFASATKGSLMVKVGADLPN